MQLEAPVNGGRVDVLAERGRERIVVEVETGKSAIVANVRRALQAKADTVLVVATDDAALRTVERELAEAGLIVPGRVRIVLRGTSASDRSQT